MGRKAFPHCKVPGCTGDRHVWPSGERAVYCDAHLWMRSTKKRDDLPSMSGEQRRTLLHLRECKRAGWPFVELDPSEFNGRTVRTLAERYWVFISRGEDGVRVGITGHGMEALNAYLPPRNRHDGICPACEMRPRRVRRSGKIAPYCTQCERSLTLVKNNHLRRLPEYTERPCTRCHERPRHRHAGGLGCSQCIQCERERAQKRNARKRQQEIDNARKGIVEPCRNCGVRPRKVFENSVARYCTTCLPIVNRTRRMKSVLQKQGLIKEEPQKNENRLA